MFLQYALYLFFVLLALFIGQSQHKGKEDEFCVLVVQLLRELVYQLSQYFNDLLSAFAVEVTQVLNKVVDMLAHSAFFHGVLKNELHKYLRACVPDGLADVSDEHDLYLLLNQVIYVCTYELLVHE